MGLPETRPGALPSGRIACRRFVARTCLVGSDDASSARRHAAVGRTYRRRIGGRRVHRSTGRTARRRRGRLRRDLGGTERSRCCAPTIGRSRDPSLPGPVGARALGPCGRAADRTVDRTRRRGARAELRCAAGQRPGDRDGPRPHLRALPGALHTRHASLPRRDPSGTRTRRPRPHPERLRRRRGARRVRARTGAGDAHLLRHLADSRRGRCGRAPPRRRRALRARARDGRAPQEPPRARRRVRRGGE